MQKTGDRFQLYLFYCFYCVLLTLPLPGSGQAQQTGSGRIRVTADGHFLQKADGTAFFWLGDTGWELFRRLNRKEILHYLDTRKKQGFNVIQAVVWGSGPDRFDGHPLHGDIVHPDTAYLNFIEWVMKQALRRNLVMALLPTWGDKVSGLRSKEPPLFDSVSAYNYGLLLARRFSHFPNLVWITGGDTPASTDSADWRPVWRAMIHGLREGDPDPALITYHPWGESSSTQYWQNDDSLDFNMMQSGHRARDLPLWNWVRRDIARSPARPVIDGEPNYEDHPVNWDPANGYFRDYDVRKQLYRSVFSGACGVTYGHHAVWQFYADTSEHPYAFPDRFWKAGLLRPGAKQAGFLKQLMLRFGANNRVADQAMIVSGQGENGEYITALRGTDSSYAMVYLPVARPVVLRTGWAAGKRLACEWFDPSNAAVIRKWTESFKTNGTFIPPTGRKEKDWVLVMRVL